MPNGNVYTPAEVYAILKAEARRNNNDKLLGVVIGTAIVLRESNGNAKAFRDASKNPDGGNDRGWWQFNDKYHPDVSDIVAYDPIKSTAVAYQKSKGFTEWKPWFQDGKLRFDGPNGLAAYQAAVKAAVDSGDKDIPFMFYEEDGKQYVNGEELKSGVEQVVDKVIPWADTLAAILSRLVSVDFWKRVGITVLGAAIIVAGLILFFGQDTVKGLIP
jgi:hypothetical protein